MKTTQVNVTEYYIFPSEKPANFPAYKKIYISCGKY